MRPNSVASIDQDLADQLERANENQLRAAALLAVRFALARIPLMEPAIAEGLQALEEHRYGDQDVRSRVEAVVRKYDEQQWGLQEDGQGDSPAYSDAFEKARAANALYYALDPDPWLAATRAIYDTEAATEDLPGLRREVLSGLAAS